VRRKRELEPGRFGLLAEELPKPLTARSIFAEDGPLELEVGTGKGTFLVAESQRRPDTLFLGVEYARRYWLYAADRLRRNDCVNARVVLADATSFVRDYFEDGSLAGVHVYFPDPWPKKRHHKRRLVQKGFVDLLLRKMSPGARLQVATDHAAYYQQIRDVLEHSELEPVPFGPTAAATGEEVVGSNFERKYRQQGRDLYTVAGRKRGPQT